MVCFNTIWLNQTNVRDDSTNLWLVIYYKSFFTIFFREKSVLFKKIKKQFTYE